MITDRDVCVALGTRDEKPSQILVDEVMPAKPFTCTPEDTGHCARKTIRRQKIRRLPVIDGDGVLRGILCMDDIAAVVQPRAGKHEISFDDIVETYESICERPLPGLTPDGRGSLSRRGLTIALAVLKGDVEICPKSK